MTMIEAIDSNDYKLSTTSIKRLYNSLMIVMKNFKATIKFEKLSK